MFKDNKKNKNIRYIKLLSKENDCSEIYKLATPRIVKKYENRYKTLSKKYKNIDAILCILYEEIKKNYLEETNINYKIERIHIKTKLGSYLSGGCGIGPSLLITLIGSSMFTYMNYYFKKLTFPLTFIYCSILVLIAIYLLTIQDNQVEMYNLFLEIFDDIQNDNIKKKKLNKVQSKK